MENQRKFYQSILIVALITLLILSVPLVAMQFTDEVNWSIPDFIIMGALLFGTGMAYVSVTRFATEILYRVAFGLALGSTLFMIWVNLAVGLIGSGPNLGNLMYMGVVTVVIIGCIRSRFKPGGMESTMYATALALVLVTVVALLANMDEYPGSSIKEIIIVNAFFAALFLIAGSLFHFIARDRSPEKSGR